MIGIATIFQTGNYGGTLQARALLRAIEKNGLGEAEIIPYSCDSVKGRIDLKFLRHAGLFRTAVALVEKMYYHPRMKGVGAFVRSYVKGPMLKKEQLADLEERYELFLSGSDQIWNPQIQQGDYFYLLSFVKDPKKKRSYASSFGTKTIPEEYRESYRALLGEYHAISVREKEGADLVEELIGKRPPVVLDPVLLLSKEDWEEIIPEKIKKTKKNYLFVYQMAHSSLLAKIASRYRKERGGRVEFVPFPIGGFCRCTPRLGFSSPEWLGAIRDAEFVATDSFHAAVFSILFRKPFYYVVTSETIKKRLSRVQTLLSSLGLEDRIIYSEKECDLNRAIDYEAVEKKLAQARAESLEVLKEMLKK